MRIVGLCAVIIALSLASSASLAQQSRDGYASETSERIARALRNYHAIFGTDPRATTYALPDVYERQYKRGTMANMSVTDQISWARFQYAYIAFLTWYVNCYQLPTIDNAPVTFPAEPVEKRGSSIPPPGATPPAGQSPPLKPPAN
jgi:hypothetical protein